MKNFKNISGFPESIDYTKIEKIESICKKWAKNFGASPILLPIVEKRSLFERSIGDGTDIVEKEMITLCGKDKEVLRPEGTAVAMRMWNNNGGLRNIRPQKWYYSDFMFRNENPQAGRYKQFKQFGMECIGFKEGLLDVDLLISLNDLFVELKVKESLVLKINTIGSQEEREKYIVTLQNWLNLNKEDLDPLSVERIDKNPLRVFDTKIESTLEKLKEAPCLYDSLSEISKLSFSKIQENLKSLGVDFIIDTTLVRGLDYYNGLVFEFVINKDNELFGKTVAAGGRYDNLSKSMNGENVEAIGFAIGLERLNFIVEQQEKEREGFYICWFNDVPEAYVLNVARSFRNKGEVVIDPGKRKIVKQLNQADEGDFEYCIIIGQEEVANNIIKIKNLKTGQEVVQNLV